MQKTAEQILCDIIAESMGLGAASEIWVRDQNRKIPADNGLYIIVGMVDSQALSSKMHMIQRVIVDPPATQQVEITEAQTADTIQIDVVSSSNAALLRRWEIIAALRSIYAAQQQEVYNFHIPRLPAQFVNTSIAEGGSQLNRFSLSFKCLVWYRKEKILTEDGGEYYDDFTTRVDDALTIGEENGIFEFSITPEE